MIRMARTTHRSAHPRSAVSLTELLCVMCILAVLGSLYLGAILRAYLKIMAFIKTLQ